MKVGTHTLIPYKDISPRYYRCQECGIETFFKITTGRWVTSTNWGLDHKHLENIEEVSCNNIVLMGIIK